MTPPKNHPKFWDLWSLNCTSHKFQLRLASHPEFWRLFDLEQIQQRPGVERSHVKQLGGLDHHPIPPEEKWNDMNRNRWLLTYPCAQNVPTNYPIVMQMPQWWCWIPRARVGSHPFPSNCSAWSVLEAFYTHIPILVYVCVCVCVCVRVRVRWKKNGVSKVQIFI